MFDLIVIFAHTSILALPSLLKINNTPLKALNLIRALTARLARYDPTLQEL